MSKYGVFSGLHFPVFGLNTGKYGPEETPYLDTFTQYYGKGALAWNDFISLGNSYVAITCSKLTLETLEQGVKYVQS